MHPPCASSNKVEGTVILDTIRLCVKFVDSLNNYRQDGWTNGIGIGYPVIVVHCCRDLFARGRSTVSPAVTAHREFQIVDLISGREWDRLAPL